MLFAIRRSLPGRTPTTSGELLNRDGDGAGGYGGRKAVVVLGVEGGVGYGEVGDGFVEDVVRAEVAGDGDLVAAATVGAGQGPTAHAAVHAEAAGGEFGRVDRAFHVPELAYVVVRSVRCAQPAKED